MCQPGQKLYCVTRDASIAEVTVEAANDLGAVVVTENWIAGGGDVNTLLHVSPHEGEKRRLFPDLLPALAYAVELQRARVVQASKALRKAEGELAELILMKEQAR